MICYIYIASDSSLAFDATDDLQGVKAHTAAATKPITATHNHQNKQHSYLMPPKFYYSTVTPYYDINKLAFKGIDENGEVFSFGKLLVDVCFVVCLSFYILL